MVLFFVVLFLILLPSFSRAAEPAPAESLPPMVVTATRTEVPLNQLTTSLTVITSEEFASGKRNWYRRSCATSRASMSLKRGPWGRPLPFSFVAPHQIRCWFWSTALK